MSIKQLHDELVAVKERISELSQVIHDARWEMRQLHDHAAATEQAIRVYSAEKKGIGPRVSDHALLRYMERKRGLNLDDLRAEIMCEEVTGAIRAGAHMIKMDGMKFLISKDGCITTVLNNDMNVKVRERT